MFNCRKKRKASIDNDQSKPNPSKAKAEVKKKNESTAKKPKDCKRNLQNSSDLKIKSSGKSAVASKGRIYQYFIVLYFTKI